MNGNRNDQEHNGENQRAVRRTNLRDSKMMAHLLEALERGEDIGHYGRLTFAMVARFFMPEDELVRLLSNQPDMEEQEAWALVLQVNERDYNPPNRNRILEWQEQQDFMICPDPDDPRGCNVYSELEFPERIYEQIDDFWMERADTQD